MSEAAEPPPQRIERLERELRLARAELDEFTRAVSHDLRAPNLSWRWRCPTWSASVRRRA